MVQMQCGGCGELIPVTRKQYERENTLPCTSCPDGGIDLAHARRHADD